MQIEVIVTPNSDEEGDFLDFEYECPKDVTDKEIEDAARQILVDEE